MSTSSSHVPPSGRIGPSRTSLITNALMIYLLPGFSWRQKTAHRKCSEAFLDAISHACTRHLAHFYKPLARLECLLLCQMKRARKMASASDCKLALSPYP